ncbi:MAG: hypothetical protein ACOYOQ_09775 [Microthrixaceae bacterium]
MSPTPAGPPMRAFARGSSSSTPLGTIDAGVLARVDGAGVVAPQGCGWVLDWWIGAEDRWHHPSVETTVRQHSVGGTPVRETALRVPGGDIVQRSAGVVADAVGHRGAAVVVEFENRSAVPVALALVVRPLAIGGDAPSGPGGRIVTAGVSGAVVRVDGLPAVVLDRPAARAAAGRCRDDAPGGTVATRLAAADDGLPPLSIEDRDGVAELAVVVALAHTATVRVLIPGPDLAGALDRVPDGEVLWSAPPSESVVAGWERHLEALPEVRLGDPAWVESVRRASSLLLVAGPDEVGTCLDRTIVPEVGTSAGRAARVAGAMARLGADDQLVPVARGLAAAQRLGGSCRMGDRSDGSVALLWAAAAVLGGPRGPVFAEELVAPAAVAIRRLRRGHGLDGVDPADAAAALRMLAPALVAVGQPEVAADAVAVAGRVAADAVAVAGRVAADAVSRATPVDPWPATEDGLPGGDVAALADRLCPVLDLAGCDSAAGVEVLGSVSPSWLGAAMDVRSLRCAWGSLSWSLRWHGERPALLWEIEAAEGLGEDPAPTVRAPGLDPGFVGLGWSGEALLGSSAVDAAGDAGVSFS